MRNPSEIDPAAVAHVKTHIERIRSCGLTEAAELFENTYWGWLRIAQAYVCAHPYVGKPEPGGMTPLSALTVVDSTFGFWGKKIPGTPKLDDEGVLREAAADDRWHRNEDRRMRRAAGEEI